MKTFSRFFLSFWFCFAYFLLFSTTLQAQIPNFAWVNQGGGPDIDEPSQIQVDQYGNSYVIGVFKGSATFGNNSFLSTNSDPECFLAKYNQAGILIWIKRADIKLNNGRFNKIALDKTGNCWLAGEFRGTITLGSYTLNSSNNTGFLAKLDSGGNTLWAIKNLGTAVTAVTTDTGGNVYLAGFYNAQLNLDTITITPNGYNGLFVIKMHSQGSTAWARNIASFNSGESGIFDMTLDQAGNIYVTGGSRGSLIFDSTILSLSGGESAAFVSKLNSQGALEWVRSGGGSAHDQTVALGIAVDENMNTYITGYIGSDNFSGQITVTFDTIDLTTHGYNDLYIAKYDSTGNLLWIKTGGSLGHDMAFDIVADEFNNVYATGYLSENATVGSQTILTNGYQDIFICKFTSSGNLEWIKVTGGPDFDFGASLDLDSNGNIYIVGSFSDQTYFSGSSYLSSAGLEDIFIAKLTSHTTGLPSSPTSTLSTYPNPFSTSFQISLTGTAPSTATLTDMLGRQVHRQVVSAESGSKTASITPPDNLPSGLYVLQIQEGENVLQVRVVRE